MHPLFKQYSILRAKRVALEEEEELLRAGIVAEMKKAKLEKAESAYGIFTIAYRAVWAYSPVVKKLEDVLKIKKIREQEKGVAKAVETSYLRYSILTEKEK